MGSAGLVLVVCSQLAQGLVRGVQGQSRKVAELAEREAVLVEEVGLVGAS